MVDPEIVINRLAADHERLLMANLRTLAVHGSWVFGDFALGRSDLDFVAVLVQPASLDVLAKLDGLHTTLAGDPA